MQRKKLTIEYIKEQFEKEEYALLSKKYINNIQKLDYICPKGHKHSVTWANWRRKNRCPHCSGRIKLTIEFIRSEFKKEGYKLLTTEYINNKQKLGYICPKGHKHNIIWGSWQQGCRCPYCDGQGKSTIEFIRSEFAKEGYELLTKKYINCEQKLEFICRNKHYHSISWKSWQQESRCFYCSNEKRGNDKRLDLGFIKLEFEKENYTLLTNKYIDCKQRLDYICSKGHKHSITWGHWQQGQRCPYCYGNVKLSIEFIRSEFEKEGYQLLTNEYINSKQRLYYICPNGHKFYIKWYNWSQNKRCLICSGKVRYTIEFIKSEFEKENYVLITKKYVNNRQKLHLICPNGHNYYITWGNWSQGKRCPKCSNNGISKWEIEIRKFLDNSNINYISNDRTQLINPNTKNSLELDIWVPELNKAVECNGIYWHTSKERKQCDSIKQQLCKDRNIDLLVVTDKEWNEDIEKCKSKVINFIEN